MSLAWSLGVHHDATLPGLKAAHITDVRAVDKTDKRLSLGKADRGARGEGRRGGPGLKHKDNEHGPLQMAHSKVGNGIGLPKSSIPGHHAPSEI